MSKTYPVVVVLWCAACGGNFGAASDGSGGTGQAGSAAEGGASAAGAPSGGAAGVAGSIVGAAGASGASSAGAAGTSAGAGGSTAGSGGAAGVDCTALKAEYHAAVEKARVCDKGSTDECSASSTLKPVGCGCAVLVNAKSEYTAIAQAKYKEIQAGKCDGGLTCGIACLPVASAQCSSQPMTSGNVFMCTGSSAIAN